MSGNLSPFSFTLLFITYTSLNGLSKTDNLIPDQLSFLLLIVRFLPIVRIQINAWRIPCETNRCEFTDSTLSSDESSLPLIRTLDIIMDALLKIYLMT